MAALFGKTWRSLEAVGKSKADQVQGIAGVVMLSTIWYLGSRMAIEGAGRLHWSVGLIAALLFALATFGAMRLLLRAIAARGRGLEILLLFIVTLYTAMTVCAWCAYALHVHADAPYKSARGLDSPTVFCDLFFWVFIDLIPVADVWKTLGVPRPIDPLSPLAAAPELAFRVLVAIPLIAAAKEWFGGGPKPAAAAPTEAVPGA